MSRWSEMDPGLRRQLGENYNKAIDESQANSERLLKAPPARLQKIDFNSPETKAAAKAYNEEIDAGHERLTRMLEKQRNGTWGEETKTTTDNDNSEE